MRGSDPPPSEIDGAEVLWWAASGDVPFGFCSDEAVHGFAICRYASGALYRFSCTRAWETVNDSPHATEEEAKAVIPLNYDAGRISWVRRRP